MVHLRVPLFAPVFQIKICRNLTGNAILCILKVVHLKVPLNAPFFASVNKFKLKLSILKHKNRCSAFPLNSIIPILKQFGNTGAG